MRGRLLPKSIFVSFSRKFLILMGAFQIYYPLASPVFTPPLYSSPSFGGGWGEALD
jgi:hypothetical protein